MAKKIRQSFLGTGWSFPPTFNSFNRHIEMVSEEQDIVQSLHILINTIPGERIMSPTYGCDLHRLVFDQLSPSLENEIKSLVSQAILEHEPRVIVDEVQVRFSDEQPGLVYILVDYTVRLTNSRSNMVYPFYIKEGTNLSADDYLSS